MAPRRLLNVFLVAYLFCILIDGLPSIGLFHDRLKAGIDPLLDKTGLWQESWRLFAPAVDKMNVRVSAEVSYADGSRRVWRSPDWSGLSIRQRFLRFREMEFIDSIRNDSSAGAWARFADYLLRERMGDSGDLRPTRVVLKRHWAIVPEPRPGDRQPRSRPLPMEGEYVIYTREIAVP